MRANACMGEGGGQGHACAHFVFLIAMSDYAHFVFLIAMSYYAYPFSEALHRISFLLPVGAEHIIYGKKEDCSIFLWHTHCP